MAAVVTGTMSQRAPLSKLQSLNGLFAVYKKQGPTSADVLNRLKEKLLEEMGEKHQNPRKRKKALLKMGHGGTLDSAASGVLVVGIGSGTKMLTTMLTGSKKYSAIGELGKATDTLDATGSVTQENSFEHITREDMEEKLKKFTGEIMQVPPLYSALKRNGQRLSVLLKQGQKVEAKPARPVTVYHLSLKEFSPPLFTLDIECGGGFYVRSLVDDLGKELSSSAHVRELTRTKQGQFTLEHALHEEHWTVEHISHSLKEPPGLPAASDGSGEMEMDRYPAVRPESDREEPASSSRHPEREPHPDTGAQSEAGGLPSREKNLA